MVNGDLIGAKVSKLKIYDAQQINEECSREPGLTRADYLYEEIVFETETNKFKCIGDITPGFSSFNPGLLFSNAISEQSRGPSDSDEDSSVAPIRAKPGSTLRSPSLTIHKKRTKTNPKRSKEVYVDNSGRKSFYPRNKIRENANKWKRKLNFGGND